MFNGMIDLTEVRTQRGSSSLCLGGNSHHRRMEQYIVNEKLEQWPRALEECNL
jgi:hypothetical protein